MESVIFKKTCRELILFNLDVQLMNFEFSGSRAVSEGRSFHPTPSLGGTNTDSNMTPKRGVSCCGRGQRVSRIILETQFKRDAKLRDRNNGQEKCICSDIEIHLGSAWKHKAPQCRTESLHSCVLNWLLFWTDFSPLLAQTEYHCRRPSLAVP